MREERARRAYAVYAPIYDRVFGLVFHRGRTATARRLAAKPGERVLEVGVGTGLMLPLYPSHCEVVGVDFSAEMLGKARDRVTAENLRNVRLQRMDARRLAFPDGSFDAVVAAYVVTAVPDYRSVLAEIVRVCRPGGRVILTNHFRNGRKLFGALERISSPLFEHAGFRTDLTMGDVLEGSGLRVTRIHPLPPFGMWRVVECVKPGESANGA
jgi:phosphatidylethanolamine/phosphatidyl-N-methylethanolamine N-methyltransferase